MATKTQIKKVMQLLLRREVGYHEVEVVVEKHLEQIDIIDIIKTVVDTKRSAIKQSILFLEEENDK